MILIVGLFILAGLFVPTFRLIGSLGASSGPGEVLFEVALFLWPSIALIMAAVLIAHGLTLMEKRKQPASTAAAGGEGARGSLGLLAVASFVLSALLILKTLHNLFWLSVWDSTENSLDWLWIVLPALAALYAGAMLDIRLRKRFLWVGLCYAVLLPAAIIVVFAGGQQADFRRLTEARAGQVSRLVEAYYAREGRYPQDLSQAKPGYPAALPMPVIIYGQDWCYQAGEAYYRLGYVYREHWSSPQLIGRVYATGGRAPDLEEICAEEILAMQRRNPRFYGHPIP